MIGPDDPRHGSPRGYRGGCHERCCLDAVALYQRRHSKLRKMGQVRRIDPTGTRRRLQALQASGWSQAAIARAGGFSSASAVNKVLRDSTSWVFIGTAAKTRLAYDRLSMAPGPSSVARLYAERQGWPRPLAWDDETIDDPAAKPYRSTVRAVELDRAQVDEVLVQRALAGQRVNANRAERRLIIERWTAAGRSLRELDAIQGITTRQGRPRRQAEAS